jgi:hypothetical protein
MWRGRHTPALSPPKLGGCVGILGSADLRYVGARTAAFHNVKFMVLMKFCLEEYSGLGDP